MRLKVSPEFLLKNSHQNKIEKRRSCQEKLFFLYLLILESGGKESKEGRMWAAKVGSEVYGGQGTGTNFAVTE